MRKYRSHVFAACFLLASALVAVLAAVPASAAASSTICTGSSHATYNPGLTLTPQTVSVTETDVYSSCTSTDPTLTSGSLSLAAFTIPDAACNDLSAGGSGALTVNWNNGQSSTATLTYELTVTGGILQTVGTGTITAGQFTGATAVFTWVYPIVNPLLCLTPGGLTTHDGIITAVITGV
ncbi:hypothetical protein [Sorangium sp. So ce176]|uniref:hypothetical protein n=1 Tax=Sorangium sp. So ce176 TaxID=3133286 RepID=UPI003F6172A7